MEKIYIIKYCTRSHKLQNFLKIKFKNLLLFPVYEVKFAIKFFILYIYLVNLIQSKILKNTNDQI